ncbi:MAG: hypothetical protein HUU38_21290 [Anaerolineales bacterium]|nr:hypothetical protein [Anaerolineales bacterium]
MCKNYFRLLLWRDFQIQDERKTEVIFAQIPTKINRLKYQPRFFAMQKSTDKSNAQEKNVTLLLEHSQAELKVLAHTMLASEYQDRLEFLLGQNREGKLSAQEEQELDDLLAEIDQLALLKAKADYTLSLLPKNH